MDRTQPMPLTDGRPIDAHAVAYRVHKDQIDRDGESHILHVSRVAELVPEDADHLSVAWLHDVLEDSDWTPVRLFDHGFDTRVIHAVITLTRRQNETYSDYIERVAVRSGVVGEIARTVKEADLIDNLHRCLETQDPAARRYRKALPVIQAAL